MDYRHLAPPWISPARGAPNRAMQIIHRRRIVSSYTPVVTSGLVLGLDGGSGTNWVDITGNSQNATLTNGASFVAFGGNSILFDGVNDCAVLPLIAHGIGAGDFHWSVWAYATAGRNTTSTPAATNAGLIACGEYAPVFGHDLNLSGQLGFYWMGSFRGFGTTMPRNQWVNVAMERDGGVVKGYINTVACATSHAVTTSMANSQMVIGRSGVIYAPDVYKGNLSIPLIYNRALTAGEKTQNFNETKARFGL